MNPLPILTNIRFMVEILTAETLFLRGEPRKKPFAARVSLCVLLLLALSICFSAQTAVRIFHIGTTRALFLRYLLLWLLSGIYPLCAYACRRGRLMLVMVCAYTLQHAVYSAQLAAAYLLAKAGLPLSGTAAKLAGVLTIEAVLYTILDITLVRRINRARGNLGRSGLLLLSAGVFLNVFAFDMGTGLVSRQAFLFRIVTFVDCILVLIVVIGLTETRSLRRDMEEILSRQRAKEEYYENLKTAIETTNIRWHDLKHQILRLKEHHPAAEGDTLFSDIEQEIQAYDGIARTGNEAIDIVLTEKSLLCQSEGIQFGYMVDGEAFAALTNAEIYSLFGNLLDNAIEAVRRLDVREKRIIRLTARRRNQFLMMEVINYFDGRLAMEGETPETTKPDRAAHGYGLKSIRYIVEGRGGEIAIRPDGDLFTLSIVIPLAEKSEN